MILTIDDDLNMSNVLKATTILTLGIGLLFSFFAFATTRWVESVEGSILEMRQEAKRVGDKTLTLEHSQRDASLRLERIETKLDKLLTRP